MLMSDYQKIYAGIQQKAALKPKEVDELPWKPKECTDFVLPEFRIPESRKKKHIREMLSKTLAFIDCNKHRRLTHGCTIMPIPQTSKQYISICGSHQEVSRLIAFMTSLGLIAVANSRYSFDSKTQSNRSKTYFYFYDNEVKVKAYCTENEIPSLFPRNVGEVENVLKETLVHRFENLPFEPSQVRFSSKLYLLKPADCSQEEFEKILNILLHQNYPTLRKYQELADEINERFYGEFPDFRITYRPNFTWNSTQTAVVKIGIRATNALCGAPKVKIDGVISRPEILNQYHLDLEKDVRSSVPRLTLSLNCGEWVPETEDLYSHLFDFLSHTSLDGELTEFNQNEREIVKSLFLRAYFDDVATIGANTRRAMIGKKDKDYVDEAMTVFHDGVEAVCGGLLYDSEIFFHESNVYLLVTRSLLEQGYNVWQVYDAWYAHLDGVSQDSFEDEVTASVAECFTHYALG